MPLRYLAQITAGQSPVGATVEDLKEGLPFIQGNAEFTKVYPNPRLQCAEPPKRCVANDILLSVRAPVGAINVADRSYGIGRGLAAIRLNKNLDRQFFRYSLICDLESLHAAATGTTFAAVTVEDVANLRISLPPFTKQRQIANFLDEQVNLLDRAVELRRHQMGLDAVALDSEAQSLLIPPHDPLESGVSLRRYICRVQTGGTPSSTEQQAWSDEGVPWYRPGSFNRDLRLDRATQHVSQDAIRDGLLPLYPAGSVLVVGVGATSGRIAYLDHPATSNQQITALVPRSGVNGRYIAWSLWARRQMILATAPFTTLPILNNDTLRSVRLTPLTRTEQDEAVRKLDDRWNVINDVRKILDRSIALLQERKQALITAAVTGQLDVTTARSGLGVDVP